MGQNYYTKEEWVAISRRSYLKHKVARIEKEKIRRQTDPIYRLKNNLRRSLRQSLKKRKTSKSNKTVAYLGCSKEFFKSYLERKFSESMSWDNYGKWHIDHIKPLSKFDLSKEEEVQKAMHYTNLQPLWAHDNLVKNAKYGLSTDLCSQSRLHIIHY